MSMVMTPDGPRHSGRGQIQVIFGPMFSGKTTELLRRVRRFEIAQHSCLLIKYNLDDRYHKNCVATHDRQLSTAAAIPASELMPLAAKASHYGIIGIDEGQFFPDIVDFCDLMANKGKTVVVAALDGTFQRKPFNNVLELIPLAESVVKLRAVCMNCCHDASFTRRLGCETQVEVIGGADKYMAVCRNCFASPYQALTSTPVTKMLSEDSSVSRQLFQEA